MTTAQAPAANADKCGPGIHPLVPAETYHAWPGASNSRLTDMIRSPGHCRDKMLHPAEPTPAMRLGTAIHYAIIEPDEFDKRYVIGEMCSASTARGDQCSKMGSVRVNGDWFCSTHRKALKQGEPDDIEVMTPDDYRRCLDCQQAAWTHPAAAKLLGSIKRREDREVSAVWHDDETGVLCKLRADLLGRDLGVCADIKTTIDASPASFTKSIFNFGYHRQGAHYLHGLAANGVPVEHFVIVAIEKEPPYGVAVYRLDDEAIAAGRAQLLPLLERFGECESTGRWPTYPDDIQDITLPAWAWKQIDNAL